jgi:hypothetical protein
MVLASNLLFIISQPRSGSTLTQKIISNNNWVETASEPWLLLPYLSVFRPDLYTAAFKADVARNGIADYLKKMNLEKDYKENLGKFLLSLYPVSEGKKYFIDKTPRYYEILDEIIEIFPDARFLILKRSPFAALYSMLQTWSGFKTDTDSLKTFYRDFLAAPQKIQKFASLQKSNPKVMEVKYEDIVSSPEEKIKDMYQWADLPFSQDVLNIGANTKVKGMYGDDVYKKKSANTIEPDKNANWEIKIKADKNLSRFFDEYSAYLGSSFLREYGYHELKTSGKTGSLFKKTDFKKLIEFAASEQKIYG